MNQRGMDVRAIETLLYHQSGLLGVSGISSDMRTLLASRDQRAKLAIDLFCYETGKFVFWPWARGLSKSQEIACRS
jgi:acetate kinase